MGETGRGSKPVSWKTLTEVLRDIDLYTLASEIEVVKSVTTPIWLTVIFHCALWCFHAEKIMTHCNLSLFTMMLTCRKIISVNHFIETFSLVGQYIPEGRAVHFLVSCGSADWRHEISVFLVAVKWPLFIFLGKLRSSWDFKSVIYLQPTSQLWIWIITGILKWNSTICVQHRMHSNYKYLWQSKKDTPQNTPGHTFIHWITLRVFSTLYLQALHLQWHI